MEHGETPFWRWVARLAAITTLVLFTGGVFVAAYISYRDNRSIADTVCLAFDLPCGSESPVKTPPGKTPPGEKPPVLAKEPDGKAPETPTPGPGEDPTGTKKASSSEEPKAPKTPPVIEKTPILPPITQRVSNPGTIRVDPKPEPKTEREQDLTGGSNTLEAGKDLEPKRISGDNPFKNDNSGSSQETDDSTSSGGGHS